MCVRKSCISWNKYWWYLQCELVFLCCKQIHHSVLLLTNQQLKEGLLIVIIGNMFKSFRTERDTTLKNPVLKNTERIYIKIYPRSWLFIWRVVNLMVCKEPNMWFISRKLQPFSNLSVLQHSSFHVTTPPSSRFLFPTRFIFILFPRQQKHQKTNHTSTNLNRY